MYNNTLSTEQKRKLEKINMVLNNLEQRLGYDEDLCRGVAKIIDMTIETDELVERLEDVQTNIPVIEQKIQTICQSCQLSCRQSRIDICSQISDMLMEKHQLDMPPEMTKIHKTIDYCIANYSLYTKSKYYASYSDGNDSTKNTSSMSLADLLNLY